MEPTKRTAERVQWPWTIAGFEQLSFIDSILRGARDGVDGVGILTRYSWLPDGIDGVDVWGDTWLEARARWIKEIAPLLLDTQRG